MGGTGTEADKQTGTKGNTATVLQAVRQVNKDQMKPVRVGQTITVEGTGHGDQKRHHTQGPSASVVFHKHQRGEN